MTEETKCSSCSEDKCQAKDRRPGELAEDFYERQTITSRLCQIKEKLVVLSGKGGVGKSTVAVNLATALTLAGKKVGLLDIDIHGPSIPKMLHLENAPVTGTETTLDPVIAHKMKVMSIGLLLRDRDDAVIWRGPMKSNAIKQFLRDVEWGELDYLIVDSPPGTGDEPMTVIQLLDRPTGAIVVTTPQALAVQDVRRSIMFCRQLQLPVVGVIENMSGFVCPKCGEHTDIFQTGGGEAMARDMGVPFLGSVPIDPQVTVSGDGGQPVVQAHPHSETSKAFGRIVRSLLEPELAQKKPIEKREGTGMKIAVPVAQGMLAMHFGHCEQFAVFEVDSDKKTILSKEMLTPPRHEPGVLPKWLSELGAKVIITGGMGIRAQNLFTQNGVDVVVGAPAEDPEKVVQSYLDGTLKPGANICDH
jgi:ATP-binding protein involved in chromosome partitioning